MNHTIVRSPSVELPNPRTPAPDVSRIGALRVQMTPSSSFDAHLHRLQGGLVRGAHEQEGTASFAHNLGVSAQERESGAHRQSLFSNECAAELRQGTLSRHDPRRRLTEGRESLDGTHAEKDPLETPDKKDEPRISPKSLHEASADRAEPTPCLRNHAPIQTTDSSKPSVSRPWHEGSMPRSVNTSAVSGVLNAGHHTSQLKTPSVAAARDTGHRALLTPNGQTQQRATNATTSNAAMVRGLDVHAATRRATEQRTSAPKFIQPNQPAEPETLLAGQALRGLAAALRNHGGSVSMRLMPESLGEMRVRMKLEGSRLEAKIEVTSIEARRLLSEQSGELRAALEARGVSVERLEIHAAKSLDPDTSASGATHDTSWGSSGGADQGFTGGNEDRESDRARSGPEHRADEVQDADPSVISAEPRGGVPEAPRLVDATV